MKMGRKYNWNFVFTQNAQNPPAFIYTWADFAYSVGVMPVCFLNWVEK